jgi:pilus assembly protein CpaB
MLTPGMRAVSVPVDATSGIAGLVFPGDRVDLILTLIIKKPKNQLPRRASETVLSNVRVLAMDQRIDDQSGEPVLAKNATLELTAKQVEMVTVAADLGRLSMSLRSLARNDVSLNDRPERRRFTMDSEASALIGRLTVGRRPSITVTVMRGMDSQKKFFSGPAVRAAKPKRLLKWSSVGSRPLSSYRAWPWPLSRSSIRRAPPCPPVPLR